MRLLPCLLTLVLLVPPAAAQDATADAAAARDEMVQFTLRHRLETPGTDVPAVPVDLVERLAAEAPLVHLNVDGEGGTALLQAQFAFSSLAAFTAWYRSASTRDLLRTLADAGWTEYGLAMRRQ